MTNCEERKETKNMEHHFNVELAKEYGILEAIILNKDFQFKEPLTENCTVLHLRTLFDSICIIIEEI